MASLAHPVTATRALAESSGPTHHCDLVAIPAGSVAEWREIVWLKETAGEESCCFAWRDRAAPTGIADHYSTPRYFPLLDVEKATRAFAAASAAKEYHGHGAHALRLAEVECKQISLHEVHAVYEAMKSGKAGFAALGDAEKQAKRLDALMNYLFIRTFWQSALDLSNPYNTALYPWMDDIARAQRVLGSLFGHLKSPTGTAAYCEIMGSGPWDAFALS